MATAVNEGKTSISAAAKMIGVARETLSRNIKKRRKGGVNAIRHGNAGKEPHNKTSLEIEAAVLKFYEDNNDIGSWQQLSEVLKNEEVAELSTKTVNRIMTRNGMKSPMTHKGPKIHNSRPPRKQQGELVQTDASDHQWFTWGRASLHGIIDDTGLILSLWFEQHECLDGYLNSVRIMVENHGIPLQIYTDRHTIFCSPKGTLLSSEELQANDVYDTQFGKALRELSIGHVRAWSPEAKGRIERLWKTLQSRLPYELRKRGFVNLEEANAWLPEYTAELNKRKNPPEANTFRPPELIIPDKTLIDVLSGRTDRVVAKGGVIHIRNKEFITINDNGDRAHLGIGKKITVRETLQGELIILNDGKRYVLRPLLEVLDGGKENRDEIDVQPGVILCDEVAVS